MRADAPGAEAVGVRDGSPGADVLVAIDAHAVPADASAPPVDPVPPPASDREVVSPRGSVRATVEIGADLAYSVSWKGKTAIARSALGWELVAANGGPLGKNLRLVKSTRRRIDETWTSPHGKRLSVVNQANELVLELQEMAGAQRRVDLILRAYDDGFAFRYRFPEAPGMETFRLLKENTEFRFTADHDAWGLGLDQSIVASGYEFPWLRTKVSTLGAHQAWGVPLLLQGDGFWMAINESNLIEWPAFFLRAGPAATRSAITELSPRANDAGQVIDGGVAMIGTRHRSSPWRVLMLGDTAGALIESDLVRNLADPPVGDFSWVKAGRSAWDSWWVGGYWPDVGDFSGMSTAMIKSYIQLAADMGWEYMTIDWGWYGYDLRAPNASYDLTRPIPAVNMPEVIRFANDRKVKLFLWARFNHAQAQMERAFPIYASWGIAGVKVDFARREDQTMVSFFNRLLDVAARNKLLVVWHNAGKPAGIERTYPNMLGREYIAGNEQSKFGDKANPTHATVVPFTRMLAGPLDYTPGAYRNVTRAQFMRSRVDPPGMGSRAHQLAMGIVYESGLLTWCDEPEAYRGQPGEEALKAIPAAWDDTRVLDGHPGERIAIARRSGNRWFIGAMGNDDRARRLDLSLDFLGPGRFQVKSWGDGPGTDQDPKTLVAETRTVTAQDKLAVNLSRIGGGYVAVITPAP